MGEASLASGEEDPHVPNEGRPWRGSYFSLSPEAYSRF
jgi:hypothetical protein